MSILNKLQTSYKKWQSEADLRAKKAMDKAETKAEKDKIKAKLAIESAKRKKAVVDAQIEQKEAETSLKKAKQKLKGDSGSSSNWFDSIINYGSKPKKTITHHKKKVAKKIVKKAHRKTTKKRHTAKKQDFSLVRMNGKMYKVYD
jgi:hypothetical protein